MKISGEKTKKVTSSIILFEHHYTYLNIGIRISSCLKSCKKKTHLEEIFQSLKLNMNKG